MKQQDFEAELAAFAAKCRESGVKVTPQRTEIYRELIRSDEHPDAETIHARLRERMPNVSADTVYRTLSTFAKMGLLRRVEAFCGRARYDVDLSAHHHFVCLRCGAIHDFQHPAADSLDVKAKLAETGTVQSVHLQAHGICHACRHASETDTGSHHGA